MAWRNLPATKTTASDNWVARLGCACAWLWTLLAGGGGLWLLLTKGPLPLTNGWFALFSGISACPLTATLFQKVLRIKLSGRTRFAAALFFWIAGRIALKLGI